MVHFKGILTIYVESSVTTARISPRDNDLGPISESDRARAEAVLQRPRGGPLGERHAQGTPLRRERFRIILFLQLYYNFVIVSNPFFQITTRFHSLSEYVKRSATLPHVRFIWARSIPQWRYGGRSCQFTIST